MRYELDPDLANSAGYLALELEWAVAKGPRVFDACFRLMHSDVAYGIQRFCAPGKEFVAERCAEWRTLLR